MLHQISTEVFLKSIMLLTVIYYAGVAAIYFPKDIMNWVKKRKSKGNNDPGNNNKLLT